MPTSYYCGAAPKLPRGKTAFGTPAQCATQVRAWGRIALAGTNAAMMKKVMGARTSPGATCGARGQTVGTANECARKKQIRLYGMMPFARSPVAIVNAPRTVRRPSRALMRLPSARSIAVPSVDIERGKRAFLKYKVAVRDPEVYRDMLAYMVSKKYDGLAPGRLRAEKEVNRKKMLRAIFSIPAIMTSVPGNADAVKWLRENVEMSSDPWFLSVFFKVINMVDDEKERQEIMDAWLDNQKAMRLNDANGLNRMIRIARAKPADGIANTRLPELYARMLGKRPVAEKPTLRRTILGLVHPDKRAKRNYPNDVRDRLNVLTRLVSELR